MSKRIKPLEILAKAGIRLGQDLGGPIMKGLKVCTVEDSAGSCHYIMPAEDERLSFDYREMKGNQDNPATVRRIFDRGSDFLEVYLDDCKFEIYRTGRRREVPQEGWEIIPIEDYKAMINKVF